MFQNNNMNNNHLQQSTQKLPVDVQPDYRTLLLMKRNSSRPPAWKSFETASDTDDTDGSDDDSSLSDSQIDVLGSQVALSDESSISEMDTSHSKSNGDVPLPNSDTYGLLKITITEQKLTKCMQVNISDSVWAIKQRVIQSLAKKLQDPLNYGFFCKRTSSFLLDHKLVSDYVAAKSVTSYELRCKRRVYHQVIRSARDSHRLLKMQGDGKRKELMRCIRQQQVEKIRSLMKKGVDPNFHVPQTKETPLIAVVNHPKSREDFDRFTLPALKTLVAGQAHLDFRNHQGYTPVHVAARNGNLQVLEALLGLGAHPDPLDNNDLSPLYHCTLSDASTNCIRTLAEAGARLDCTNSQGWTTLHQVCRYGRLTHLEILLDVLRSRGKQDELLNAQNDSGNTALHVCAIYKQEKCLVTLLREGVDSTIRNYSHQDASQVAVVAHNVNLANLIKDFPNLNDQEISLLLHHYDAEKGDLSLVTSNPASNAPDSDQRRHTLTSSVIGKHFLNRTLQRKNPFSREKSRSQITLKKEISPPLPRQCSSDRLPKRPQSTVNTIAITKENQVRDNNDDMGYFGSSNKSVMYIASDDYVAANSREVSIKKGDKVTMSSLESFGSVIPEGFCKITTGNNTGLVPKSCIQAVKLRKPQDQSYTAETRIENGGESSRNSDDIRMTQASDLHPTSHPEVFHRFRDVILSKGENGFGFVLRGAKADKTVEDFIPTPRQPGLQYLESVEPNGNAYQVGLRAEDFILKINGVSVINVGHKQTVDLIRKIGDQLHLHVVSVVDREGDSLSKYAADEKSSTTSSLNDVSSTSSSRHRPGSSQDNLSRSGSIRSALGKLDSVLAMEEGSADEETTATLRRRPVSRRLLSQDLQGVFPRQDSADVSQNNAGRETQSLSSASSRRLIRVVAPKLPNGYNEPETANSGTKTATTGASNSSNTFAPAPASIRGTSFHGSLLSSHVPVTPSSSHVPASTPLNSSGAKKPPPPPQRRSSRLSAINPDEPVPPAQATAASAVSRTPNVSQSLGRGFIGRGDLSGIAATVAMQAQQRRERLNSSEKLQSITHNLLTKPPPVVAPKPGRGSSDPPITTVSTETSDSKSAFALALAAKQAKIKNRSPSKSPVLGPGPLKASPAALRAQSSDLERSRMELPPPPDNTGNPVMMNLPPPPPPAGDHSSTLEMILPPPPDDLITGNIPPPPPEFSNEQKMKYSPTNSVSNKFKDRSIHQSLNGVDSLSNADSGVDDITLNPRSQSVDGKSNIETLSVVSSLSTVSSEDGSDAGVSLSYDPKSSVDQSPSPYLDVLKKAKADSGDSNIVLRKINFSAPKLSPVHVTPKPDVTSSNSSDSKARADVTKLPGNKFLETSAKAVDASNSLDQKPLAEWTVDDVCNWLRNLGLGTYAQVFAENEIEGGHLPDLGKEDLLELGVTRVGHRLTIEKSLKKLIAK